MISKFDRFSAAFVLIAGIGMLGFVFVSAYKMLTHPVPGLASALAQVSPASNSAGNALGSAGTSILNFLLHLSVLFIMTIAGSMLASRGLQFYHIIKIHSATGSPSKPN